MSARELSTARILDATPERVFDAWTDPAKLVLWWRPKGFRNVFHVCEPVPGGEWRFTMHAPDGSAFENRCVFVELERPRRVVIDHLEPMHRFLVTATLAPKGRGTELTFRLTFETAQECARVRALVTDANEQNLDRLENLLKENRRP